MFKQKSQYPLLDECFNENVKQNCVWGKLVKTAGRNVGEKQYVNNCNCMFHVNTYASETKVSIIKEDFMMMMVDGLICQLAP